MSMNSLQHYQRLGTLQIKAPPPLGLYVHLPWCLRKCPYCDFNSHEWRDTSTLPEQRYLQALWADLESSLPLVWSRPIWSVFIGGGTPSLFSPDTIAELISGLRARLPLQPGCEITLEANPGTFERDRFRAFAQAGVTRLSIGVQSFNDQHLQAIGRVHDRAQALAAVQEAAECFATYNIDLMYALPQQTHTELETDLNTALSFQPTHLSAYHLTLEPNTYFAKYPPVVPHEDEAYAMLDTIVERTQQAGLQRYEVSAYARAGHECTHNQLYWEFGDYVGIGAGAHGKISFAHRVIRQVRHRDPMLYMKQALTGQAVAQEHEVRRADLPFEYMLNALRLRAGFALQDYVERTGLPLSTIEPALAQALSKGLIERTPTHIRPTERGFDFLSDLQACFLPEEER